MKTAKYSLALALALAGLVRAADIEAIVDFTNQNGQVTALSNYMADELSLQLMGKGDVTLVDRGQLKKVLREQGLQVGGAFDEATIAKIGKLLGATKIVTGNYYPMGDEFQVIAKTIDVTTGKVAKAEKLKFPKSESTVKLDQTVFASAVAEASSTSVTVNTNAPAVAVGGQAGPVGNPVCYVQSNRGNYFVMEDGVEGRNYPYLYCELRVNATEEGILQLDKRKSRFYVNDGSARMIDNYKIANTGNAKMPILAGIPVSLKLGFSGLSEGLEKFNHFELAYTFNGKPYVLKATPEIKEKGR